MEFRACGLGSRFWVFRFGVKCFGFGLLISHKSGRLLELFWGKVWVYQGFQIPESGMRLAAFFLLITSPLLYDAAVSAGAPHHSKTRTSSANPQGPKPKPDTPNSKPQALNPRTLMNPYMNPASISFSIFLSN